VYCSKRWINYYSNARWFNQYLIRTCYDCRKSSVQKSRLPKSRTLSKSPVTDDEGATFCFAKCGVEAAEEEVDTKDDDDAEEGEVSDVDVEKDVFTNNNYAEEAAAEEDEGSDGDVAEVVKARPSIPKKQMCETEVQGYCWNINMKIVGQWQKAQPTAEMRLDEFVTNPHSFFGRKDFDSAEEWSYYSLRGSEEKLHLYQSPFHKVHLKKCQYGRQQVSATDNPELTSRRAMLEDLEPGFNKLPRKIKSPKYKQFERCLNQGEVLLLMLNRDAGLLLTVAPFISTKEYAP
jgi:hypothetical protein